MRCKGCERNFPKHLINELEMATDVKGKTLVLNCCPLCAYRVVNHARGVAEDTPPPESAPKARKLYLEALTHVREQRHRRF